MYGLRILQREAFEKVINIFLYSRGLKVPSGQIRSAWEWCLWIGLEKDINRYRFFIV